MNHKNTQLKKAPSQDTGSHGPASSNKPDGWKYLRRPDTVFSSWGKIRKKIEGAKIVVPMGMLANDNSMRRALSKFRMASLVLGAVALGTILGMNSSAIATQAVLHANDRVLTTAMDVSPEALAHVLNAMDVGETK